MALPSQTERSSEMNRAVMGQKGESGSRMLLIIFGFVVLAGGIFLVSKGLRRTDSGGTTTEPRTVVREAGTAGTNPSTTPTPAPNTPGINPSSNDLLGSVPGPVNPSAITATPSANGTGTGPGSSVVNPSTVVPGTAPNAAANPSGNPVVIPANSPGNGDAGNQANGANGATNPSANGALSTQGFSQLVEAGERAIGANKLVEARLILSKALLLKDAPSDQKPAIRSKLQKINEDLVFSPRIEAGDTLVESYKIQRGDALARLPRKRELAVDYRLLQRVNRITNAASIREGQTLKLVKGPFHAVVTKSEYRVDVYAGSPSEPATWLFIKSYTAGLGEGNSTPVGNYIVKKNSKLENPAWVNPRTGEKFAATDPKNPIGEYWLGWQGEGDSAQNTGYGFHGTVDAQSIGKQMSMGCVRLGDGDIAELFSLLVEEVSVVRVLP